MSVRPQPGRATLHLVCGLPGAGKSTLALRLAEDTGAISFSPDVWLAALDFDGHDPAARDRVERLQWDVARTLLAAGTDVILEKGFWSRTERDRYRAEAAAAGAVTVLHFLDVPVHELKRRVAARNRDPACLFHVDPDTIDPWAASFEPPDADELS
jgi:hypothetical protein